MACLPSCEEVGIKRVVLLPGIDKATPEILFTVLVPLAKKGYGGIGRGTKDIHWDSSWNGMVVLTREARQFGSAFVVFDE